MTDRRGPLRNSATYSSNAWMTGSGVSLEIVRTSSCIAFSMSCRKREDLVDVGERHFLVAAHFGNLFRGNTPFIRNRITSCWTSFRVSESLLNQHFDLDAAGVIQGC